jgi:glycosyltransferase involved in cell wall biosynthesis
LISVIVPTIDGREKWLDRCHASYSAWTPTNFEFIVVRNEKTCNRAWNIGIEQSSGDYIHLSADDIEAQPGWWQTGIQWIEKGYLPAPRILNPDGTLQSCGDGDWETPTGTKTELTRVPFFSREQMEKAKIYPIIKTHYCGDLYVTHRGAMAGYRTVVVREMQFIHSFANVGRLDERLSNDYAIFRTVRDRDIHRVA